MEIPVTETQTSTIEVLIIDLQDNSPMDTDLLQNLPILYVLASKYPNALLFEFDVLCRGYDYTTEPPKLIFFPTTLKGATLRWFMGLGAVLLIDGIK